MNQRFSTPSSILLLFVLLHAPGRAQEADESAPPPSERIIFEPLDLSTPNEYRAASGEPNDEYWQQEVDYGISVVLDAPDQRIRGAEVITYTNNAPDELEYLWLQLDQNLFDPDSRGAKLTPPDERFSGAFPGGGFDISRVEIVRDGRRIQPEYIIEGTEMRVALAEPLPGEGGTLELRIDFSFIIPQHGADRMGRLDVAEGTVYEIAQWYPRMFVYDDVHGWNVMPYLGQGEWYLEYGDFDVEITVPHDYIVVATGALQNPEEVLTEEQRSRLARARESAETVMIINRDEAGDPDATRPSGDDPMTWTFHAENVRDFSWAASPAFIWDAASWEDVLIMSAYPEEGIGEGGQVGWERSTQMSRHSIRFYSEFWGYDYPYPVAINVAGIVAGMEYPMIVFCSVDARGSALFGVTDHEFGHEWVPMIVGSDERRWAWMDEGLNTFQNYYSALDYYGPEGARGLSERAGRFARIMEILDTDIMTYADRIPRRALGFLGYSKPGTGLILLREYILGPDLFDSAFQEYLERWAYRHPKPADFFRTIENVAGEDLDWFWRGWFYSSKTLDQAIVEVAVRNGTTYAAIQSQSGLVMPVTLQVTYADGERERREIPVEAFYTNDTFVEVIPGDDVARLVIDPAGILPDVERADNSWTADAAAGTGNR